MPKDFDYKQRSQTNAFRNGHDGIKWDKGNNPAGNRHPSEYRLIGAIGVFDHKSTGLAGLMRLDPNRPIPGGFYEIIRMYGKSIYGKDGMLLPHLKAIIRYN